MTVAVGGSVKAADRCPAEDHYAGMPYRIGALDAALKYICKHKKVWKATGSEIARHYWAQLKGDTPAGKGSRGRDRPEPPAGVRLMVQCCGRLSSIGPHGLEHRE